jgi:DnaJ-class molecular chaperone
MPRKATHRDRERMCRHCKGRGILIVEQPVVGAGGFHFRFVKVTVTCKHCHGRGRRR